MKTLFCAVEEQVAWKDGETGWGKIEPNVEDLVIVGGVWQVEVYIPVIDQYNMDDEKSNLIDVLQVTFHDTLA